MSDKLQDAMTNLLNVQIQAAERAVKVDQRLADGDERWRIYVAESDKRWRFYVTESDKRWHEYKLESERRWQEERSHQREESDRLLTMFHDLTAMMRKLPDSIQQKIGFVNK